MRGLKTDSPATSRFTSPNKRLALGSHLSPEFRACRPRFSAGRVSIPIRNRKHDHIDAARAGVRRAFPRTLIPKNGHGLGPTTKDEKLLSPREPATMPNRWQRRLTGAAIAGVFWGWGLGKPLFCAKKGFPQRSSHRNFNYLPAPASRRMPLCARNGGVLLVRCTGSGERCRGKQRTLTTKRGEALVHIPLGVIVRPNSDGSYDLC
jgi:hypothetical protein